MALVLFQARVTFFYLRASTSFPTALNLVSLAMKARTESLDPCLVFVSRTAVID